MFDPVREVLQPRAQARLVRPPSAFDEVSDAGPGAVPLDAARMLADSARFLELLVAISAITEVVDELGLTTIASAIGRGSEVVEQASARARLDVLGAVASSRGSSPAPQFNPADAPAAPLDVTRRQVDAVLASCPIAELERLGKQLGRAEVSHRCRTAYEWLAAFVARHQVSDRLANVIGRAYAEARLSVDEVAAALQMRPTDAMAFLEGHGYVRTRSAETLNDEQRRGMFAALRADRLGRGGRPAVSEELVRRDVVASERIEGVDAREWTSSS